MACDVDGKSIEEGGRICLPDENGVKFYYYCMEGALKKSDEPCTSGEAPQPQSARQHGVAAPRLDGKTAYRVVDGVATRI